MKRLAITSALSAMLFASVPASANELFTGDVKLACEAVLCLSTGQRPSECTPSIQRYFSISMKKFSDTLKARKNFLNLCPASTQDQKMVALVDAITNGAGRCDYAALNATLMVWNGPDGTSHISNALPAYCAAYNGNAYTDIKAARYVGVPERGGFWVEAAKYDAALAEYNARIKAEDEAAAKLANSNNN